MGPRLTRPVRVADASAGGPRGRRMPGCAAPDADPRMSLELVPSSPSAYGGGFAPVLSANVLVLNKFYQAIRVVNVRRAFSLLCREMAEVVHIETDAKGHAQWQNFDFAEWQEMSALKAEFEPDEYDWIHTVRFQIAVPRIIRLLGYEKLPKQDVKINRCNIYARDSSRCQYCCQKISTNPMALWDNAVKRPLGGPRLRRASP